jgi:choline dehydrogenase
MKCITVLYPAKGNEQFDFDFYRKRHIPLIEDILGKRHVFVRTSPEMDRPDMQLTCIAAEMSARDVWYPFIGKWPALVIGVGVSMIRQDSRGVVSLRSADPLDPPRILFNLFQEGSDMARMIRGIRAGRRIYKQQPLKQLIGEEIEPGAGIESDAELEAFVRRVGAITQHPVGPAEWVSIRIPTPWSTDRCACAA